MILGSKWGILFIPFSLAGSPLIILHYAKKSADPPLVERVGTLEIQPLQTSPFNPFTAIQSLGFEAHIPGQGL